MADPDLCTDDEIAELVKAFYGKVRRDPALGPIFEAHVQDWDGHQIHLVAFWSSVLRGTGSFTGAPMPRHAALPGLTAALPNRMLAQRADEAAQRMARSLWAGYQASRAQERGG